MEKVIHISLQLTITALTQEGVVPRVGTAHRCLQIPTSVHGVPRWTPKQLQSMECYTRGRVIGIGEQGGASHGLDLPPISKEQDVEASERPARAIGSALVRSAVSHDLLQYEF